MNDSQGKGLWPERIIVARYSGMLTFVSTEEEAETFGAAARTYVPLSLTEELAGALEEIEKHKTLACWADDLCDEGCVKALVGIARSALKHYRETIGETD